MKRIQTRAIVGGTALMLAVLSAACTTPGNGDTASAAAPTDAAFGDAVRQARVRQTIDPAAGTKQTTLVESDAISAGHAIKQYDRSFEQPRPTINVLGIGGVKGSAN